MLPNALDVSFELTGEQDGAGPVREARRGLEPDELLARYYREKYAAEIAPELLRLFNELHRAEVGHAPA